jgi:uncharacterized membrane protein (UPF0127 family)
MMSGRILLGGAAWAAEAACARTPFERMRGLRGRRSLGPGAALVIERCNAVHTVGMRFMIDLVFLDRRWRVTRVVRNVRPGRLMVWGGWRSARVVEAEAGCLDVDALHVGDTLFFEDGPQMA